MNTTAPPTNRKSQIANLKSNSTGEFKFIPHAEIALRPGQPRKHFDAAKLQEFTENIRAVGILQPLLVRPAPLGKLKSKIENQKSFELVAGERRYRASQGWVEQLPCIIRTLTDLEVLEIQGIENLLREDLSPLEEAQWLKALLDSGSYTVETLQKKLGKGRSAIFDSLKLLRLSEPVRAALGEGKIDKTKAGLLAMIPDPREQAKALKAALKPDWSDGELMSSRQLKDLVEREYSRDLSRAPFDRQEEQLGGVVSCQACPKRSGNMQEEFPEVKNTQLCTEVACYARKVQAHTSRVLDKARAAGQTVLDAKKLQQAVGAGTYVDLETKNYYDGRNRKWEECLKGKEVPEVLAVDEEGQVHHLAAKSEVQKAGVKLGYESGGRSASPAEKKQAAAARAAAKFQSAVADAVCGAAVAKCEAREPDPAWWSLIAQAAVKSCWHDSLCEIGQRRYPQEANMTAAARKLEKEVAKFNPAQCRGVLLEILCLRGLRGICHVQPESQAALFYFKVDRKQIAARLKEEAKAKPAKKAKK